MKNKYDGFYPEEALVFFVYGFFLVGIILHIHARWFGSGDHADWLSSLASFANMFAGVVAGVSVFILVQQNIRQNFERKQERLIAQLREVRFRTWVDTPIQASKIKERVDVGSGGQVVEGAKALATNFLFQASTSEGAQIDIDHPRIRLVSSPTELDRMSRLVNEVATLEEKTHVPSTELWSTEKERKQFLSGLPQLIEKINSDSEEYRQSSIALRNEIAKQGKNELSYKIEDLELMGLYTTWDEKDEMIVYNSGKYCLNTGTWIKGVRTLTEFEHCVDFIYDKFIV